MKILFVADIFAQPGRRVAAALIPELIQDDEVDLVIANGENAAGGFGLTDNIARKLHSYGADIITSGNHIWDRKEFITCLEGSDRILRPYNYPEETPGIGSVIITTRSGIQIAVINLQGRTGMPSIDCPFRVGRAEIERLREKTSLIFVDFHAEATAEKMAMGFHLDGLVTAVIGTHTHVPTADERVLPQGTAHISDVGMTGCYNSVIGMETAGVLKRFVERVPERFEVASGPASVCGVIIDVDETTGKSRSIARVRVNEKD